MGEEKFYLPWALRYSFIKRLNLRIPFFWRFAREILKSILVLKVFGAL
jgi:hypothetical protein